MVKIESYQNYSSRENIIYIIINYQNFKNFLLLNKLIFIQNPNILMINIIINIDIYIYIHVCMIFLKIYNPYKIIRLKIIICQLKINKYYY